MDKITIGSDLSCTVCVNKSTIAAKHCTIETDEKGHFTVTNLEPNFETWVNGEKIENKSSFENIFNVRVGDVTLQWSEIKQDYEYDKNIKAYGIKERHWFVSFWLWLGIIANIITIPFSISEIGQSGLKSGLIGTILIIVFVSIIIICYFKLLHWKKKGFWGLVCTSIFLVVSSIIIINITRFKTWINDRIRNNIYRYVYYCANSHFMGSSTNQERWHQLLETIGMNNWTPSSTMFA